jgi:hypothetical protein
LKDHTFLLRFASFWFWHSFVHWNTFCTFP